MDTFTRKEKLCHLIVSLSTMQTINIRHTYDIRKTFQDIAVRSRTQITTFNRLKRCMQHIQDKGDFFKIDMNINDAIERYDCVSYFDELNMLETIVPTHKEQSSPAINMLNYLKYPIDRIWCSIGLKPTKEGYLKFREGVFSNHRVLWVEFRLIDVFGSSDNIYKKVLQLKASDPRNVAKYIAKTNKRLQKEQCVKKMENCKVYLQTSSQLPIKKNMIS